MMTNEEWRFTLIYLIVFLTGMHHLCGKFETLQH